MAEATACVSVTEREIWFSLEEFPLQLPICLLPVFLHTHPPALTILSISFSRYYIYNLLIPFTNTQHAYEAESPAGKHSPADGAFISSSPPSQTTGGAFKGTLRPDRGVQMKTRS